MHEVPVKLEQVKRVFKAGNAFANALCLAHQAAQASAHYSVEIFHIRRLDGFHFRTSIDDSTDFVDDAPMLSDFDQLAVIDVLRIE